MGLEEGGEMSIFITEMLCPSCGTVHHNLIFFNDTAEDHPILCGSCGAEFRLEVKPVLIAPATITVRGPDNVFNVNSALKELTKRSKQ